MKRLSLALLPLLVVLCALSARAANINLGGSVSTTGTCILGASSVVFSSDGNHTASVTEYTNNFQEVTSSVSLTTTWNLIEPLVQGQQFTVQNETTGGQSILVTGATGNGVLVPNGTTASVTCDGTNYQTSDVLGSSGTVTLLANASLSGAAGSGGLALGSMTGQTTLPTGNLLYVGASGKSMILESGAGGLTEITAGNALLLDGAGIGLGSGTASAIQIGGSSSTTTTFEIGGVSLLQLGSNGLTNPTTGSISIAANQTVLSNGNQATVTGGIISSVCQTTNATPTTCCSFTVPNNTVSDFQTTIVGRNNTNNGDTYRTDFGFTYETTSSTATEVGSPTTSAMRTNGGGSASGNPSLTSSGTTVNVQVTGAASTTINWWCVYQNTNVK